MNVGELMEAAKRFWQSIAGPLAELAAVVVTLAYTLGVGLDQLHVASFSFVPSTGSPAERALTLYGIDKIVPIAVIFLLIITAQATSDFFHLFGASLPGHIHPAASLTLAAHGDHTELLQLLAVWPSISNLEELDRKIDSEIETMNGQGQLQLAGLRIKEAQSKSLSGFLKGLGLTSILIGVAVPKLVGNHIPWIRLIAVAAVFLVLQTYISLRRIKAKSDFTQKKVHECVLWLRIHLEKPLTASNDEKKISLIEQASAKATQAGSWNFVWIRGDLNKDIRELLRVLSASIKK